MESEADASEEVRVGGVFFGAVRGHGEGAGRSGDWGLGFVWDRWRWVIGLSRKMEGERGGERVGIWEGGKTLLLETGRDLEFWISRRASSLSSRQLLYWIGLRDDGHHHATSLKCGTLGRW